MISHPKTLPARATVDDVRALLGDDHVHLVLLIDGTTLVGTLAHTDLPPAAPTGSPALPWSTLRGRTVPGDAPADVVGALLAAGRTRRLAVVDEDRTLLGLLCAKRSGTGFCSDADVAARGHERLVRRRPLDPPFEGTLEP